MDAPLYHKELSEEDTKRLYVTPALEAKWGNKISMETRITDGQVLLAGNKVRRCKPKFVDYMLYLDDAHNMPIAVIEAKKNTLSASHGMQQAIDYARRLDLAFAYSTNGSSFCEHDFITGTEREFAMCDFPTPDELIRRYKEGKHLTPEQEKVIRQPYYSGQNTNAPRYYQRIAINRTLDAIARGQQRILLVMATGTGKTYTAFQIVYRLLKSGMKKKILYLADRNILVDQSIQQDFAPLEKDTHKINVAKDDPATLPAYQVFFALYQQLVGDDDVEHYSRLFRPDFFDLIIVDECHRGSAREESRWRRILEYFDGATQIGMTATPKETQYVSNMSYFGEPLYTYSLNNGIEDGFLAPFRVIGVQMNIGDGWRPVAGQRDIYGQLIPDRIYDNKDFDYKIVLEDRIREVAETITAYLKKTDRMAKTIVFCADEEAALHMRNALNNANADMVQKNTDYVVRITGSDDIGKSKLDYFISVSQPYPVIATTSKLLSTGVDCKMVKVIAIDQMISSMTEFKQIIGRGTRLRWEDGKSHFTVLDFRNVARLFADPNWDGPIEIDSNFGTDSNDGTDASTDGETPPAPVPPPQPPQREPKCRVDKDGCTVKIIHQTVSVYDPQGRLLRQENIIDYTRENLRGEFASLDGFLRQWSSEEKKKVISDMLAERGIDLEQLKEQQGMQDVDDYDFICHVAFDRKPLTRRERANNVRKKDFFSRYSAEARAVLEALLDRYMNEGIYEIEDLDILKLAPFNTMGKPSRIAAIFGGPEGYNRALRDLEEAIYTPAV